MGALCSSPEVSFETRRVEGQDDLALDLLTRRLQLTSSQVNKFYALYHSLELIENKYDEKDDTNNKKEKSEEEEELEKENADEEEEVQERSEVHRDNLFTYYEIPNASINKRLFSFFGDESITGKLTFLSFTVSLWHFLSFNEEWLEKYLFFFFNERDRHFLTHTQMCSLVSGVLHNVADPVTIRSLHKRVYRLEPEITHDMFHTFLMDNPAVLEPMTTLQTKLRKRIIGSRFWKKQQKLRLRNISQLRADYAVRLNSFYEDMKRKRAHDKVVESHMSEWKKEREKTLQDDLAFGISPIDFNDPTTLLPETLLHPPRQRNEHSPAKKRRRKKRKRHTRGKKTGPYGGPEDWLGREAPQLEVSAEVIRQLDEKNAEKLRQKAKRKQLRAENKNPPLEIEHQSRPRIKYLPKLEHKVKPIGPPLGLASNQMSYVDNV